MNRALAGALAGCAATALMTLTMKKAFTRLPPAQRYPLPPRQITADVLERTGVAGRWSESTWVTATLAAHFGFGAAAGYLYGKAPPRESSALSGSVFGLAVWAVSYLGWVPLLHILPPATEQPKARNALMLAAHVVWGSATGILTDRLSRIAAPPPGSRDELMAVPWRSPARARLNHEQGQMNG